MNCIRALCLVTASLLASPAQADFSIEQVLDHSFHEDLVAAEHADSIAWVRNIGGARNIWIAAGSTFRPHQATHYTADDGQQITQLTFTPDGKELVYVRGGDHESNWRDPLAPDPASSPEQPVVSIWKISSRGGEPDKIADGDQPAISVGGQLAYVKDGQVWTIALGHGNKPERLFFDRGTAEDLRWSPDGHALAFVSDRGDHSFIGVFKAKDQPLIYLDPSSSQDVSPRWSIDGAHIAFVRHRADIDPLVPHRAPVPHPWSIRVADPKTGLGTVAWQSPNTLDGSYPDTEGRTNLYWDAGGRLVFTANLDGWPHLYALPATGGHPELLTPGNFMVEHVAESRDRQHLIYDANTGSTFGDFDRRHIFRVPTAGGEIVPVTSGSGSEWTPVAASNDQIAYITAGSDRPSLVALSNSESGRTEIMNDGGIPRDFPIDEMITPAPITFHANDGTPVHGQLFLSKRDSAKKPGIVFLHGGPQRQMLLSWNPMEYYDNAYALNQYLANHGFVVLSINYRRGIGYGRAFHQPDKAGPEGASEYQDVLAGAHYLQNLPIVDNHAIGIWGGSYGGYLTALALARNSDVFKAGVDLQGVHDWSYYQANLNKAVFGYDQNAHAAKLKMAFDSSPIASVSTWKSPVLLIQGDDDRNVMFHLIGELEQRLTESHVQYSELVIPNEIHNFLRHATWLKVDSATAAYLTKQLKKTSQ